MGKIKVKTDAGLDDLSIEFIQRIENNLDEAMAKNGFTRTETSKAGEYLEFNYHQFGICFSDNDDRGHEEPCSTGRCKHGNIPGFCEECK